MVPWVTLPEGWGAQMIVSNEERGLRWELYRVYDGDGRLQPERAFWAVYPTGVDDPLVQVVSLGQLRALDGRRAPTATEFYSLVTPLERVQRWLEGARRRRPSGERALVPRTA